MFQPKFIFRILINTAIGVVLIIFWLKLVDVKSILKEISQVNFLALLPFVGFFALSSTFKATRFRLLLAQSFKIPLKNMIFLTFLSQLLSFTIPLRIGEVAKGVYLSSEYGIPTARAVILVFLDRFIDFWMVLLSILILLTFMPTKLPQSLQTSLSLIVGAFTLAGGLVIFFPDLTKKIINVLSQILIFPIAKKYFTKFSEFLVDTASFLKRPPTQTLQILGLTFMAIIAESLMWYVLFLNLFKPQEVLNIAFYGQTLLGSMLSALTYLIPAAPGYVGSAEAAGLAVFSLGLGMDKTLVSAATVISHGLTLVLMLAAGLISLYLLKFNLNLVWKKFKK